MTAISHMPPAARRQAKEANRLIAEQNQPPAQPAPATPPQAPVTVQPFDPNAPAQPLAPPVSAAQPPVTPSAATPQPDPYEQRYKTLQGKYDTEISRLTQTAQQLLQQNQELLHQLNSRPAQPAPAAPMVNALDKVVTAKEREDFGEELLGLIQRISQAQSGAEIQRLNTELTNLKSSMRVTVQEVVHNKQAKVYEELNRQVPNWSVINVSDEFIAWLDVPDIMSGTARKSALMSAFEAGDAHRVVGIFKRFIEEDSRSRSGAPTTPATPTVDPATLIAPAAGRGSAGEAPNGQGERIWSEQEISDFYSKVQRGRISPEEKKSTEALINRAVAEGRVRPTRDYRSLANSA